MIRRSTEALVLAFLLAVSVAQAEPSPSDVATAKSLLVEGRQLRAQNKHELARDKFKAAWALVPTPIIGLDLARAYAACRQYVEARELALEVTRLPEGPKESAEGKAARADAATLAAEVKAKIGSLTVTLEGPSAGKGARVTIDGEVVPAEAVGIPRKVNPGKHVVVVTVGGVAQTKNVEVAEGGSEAVTVTVDQVPSPGVTEGEKPKQPTAASLERPVWPWLSLGVGAVGVVAGGVFVVLAAKKNSAIDEACPGGCPDGDALKSASELKSTRNAFWVGAALLGGVGLTAGVIGVWGLMRDPPKTAGAHLLVGPGTAAVRIVF
ncbi:MAG: hypothetical protein JNL79_21795 [Myxococcales bacterium]|nr:hypothetical protein [Myxococcales bacterium]